MRTNVFLLGVVLVMFAPGPALADDELVGVFTANYRYNAGGCSWTEPNPYFCTYIAPGPIHVPAPPGRYRIVFLDPPGNEPGSDAWSGDASAGTFIELDTRGATFNHTFGEITLYYNDWVPDDNDPGIQTTMALYRLDDVDCHAAVAYADGVLTLDFSLQTAEAVTWNVWVSIAAATYRLWSLRLPARIGPVSVPISIPAFPQLGEIGFLTTFTKPGRGITCSDWKAVETGNPTDGAAIPPPGQTVRELFRFR